MSDAANIQIKINTSDVEKADRLLAALENRSDKLYQSLSNLNKGTSFDKIRNAVKGTDTTFGKLSLSMGQVQIKSGSTAQAIGRMTGQFAANDTAIQKAANSSNRYGRELSTTSKALGVMGNKSSAASAGITKIGTSSDKVTDALKKTSAATDKLRDSNGRFVSGISGVNKGLDGTAKKSGATTSALKAMGLSGLTVNRMLGDMRGLLAGVGLVAALRGYLNMADAYKSMNASLSIVTGSQAEFNIAQQGLIGIASRSMVSLEAISKLYTGMAPSLEDLGYAQAEILKTTELVSKAMQVGGGTAVEHKNAITQLTQAMGSGVLRGDEFNSIMESGRGFAIQLAKGLGVTIGELRAMAEAGELTGQVVVDALAKQEKAINDLYSELPLTVGRAWTLVKNETLLAIGEIDGALGASDGWANILVGIAKGIEGFAKIALVAINGAAVLLSLVMIKLTQAAASWIATSSSAIAVNTRLAASAVASATGFTAAAAGAGRASVATAVFTGVATVATKALALLRGAFLFIGGPFGAAVLATTALYAYREEIGESITTTGRLEKATKLQGKAIEAAKDMAYDYATANEVMRTSISTTADEQIRAAGIELQLMRVRMFATEELIRAADAQDKLNQLNPEYVSMSDTHMRVLRDLKIEYEGQGKVVTALQKAIDNLGKSESELNIIYGEGEESIESIAKATLEYNAAIIATTEAHKANILDLMEERNAYIAGGDVLADYIREKEIEKLMIGDVAIETDNLTRSQAEAEILARERLSSAKDINDQRDKSLNKLGDLLNAQELQNIAVTEGAHAMNIARYELEGMSPAMAVYATSIDAAMEAQKEFSDALVDSIVNASSVKDAFRDMGQWIVGWLKKIIAKIAAQKIMMYIGADVSAAMSAISGLFSAASSAGSVATTGGGVITATSGAAAGAHAGSAVAGGGVSSAAIAAPFIIAAGAIYAATKVELGEKLKDTFFGFSKTVDHLDIAFKNGAISGKAVTETISKSWLFGKRKRSFEFKDLEAELEAELNGFFSTMLKSVETQAKLFGVVSADYILDNFTIDTTRLTGEDDLQEWLEESTRTAYQRAFSQLGPEMQAIMDDAFDLDTDPIEDITAAIAEMAQTIATFKPMFENAGFDLIGEAMENVTANINYQIPAQQALALAADQQAAAADAAAANTLKLVEALGGTEAAMTTMQFYLTNFFTEAEQQAMVMTNATTNLNAFNESIDHLGIATIQNKDDLRAAIEALDSSHPDYEKHIALLLQGAGAVVAYDAAMEAAKVRVEGVGDAMALMGAKFDTTSAGAQGFSDNLIQLAGGFDALKSRAQLFYDEILTEQQQQQVSLTATTTDIVAFNNAMQLTGDSVVDSKDELNQFWQDLIVSYGGVENIPEEIVNAVLEVTPAIVALDDGTTTLESALASLGITMDDVVKKFDLGAATVATLGNDLSGQIEFWQNFRPMGRSLDSDGLITKTGSGTSELELLGEAISDTATAMIESFTEIDTAISTSSEGLTLLAPSMTLLSEELSRQGELLPAITEGQTAINIELLTYNELVALQLANALLLNDSMVAYSELQSTRVEQEAALIEIMASMGDLRTTQLEQETILGELMTARAEMTTAQIEGYTLLNELIAVFNELMLVSNEQYTLINESLTLHDELIIKQVESYTLLNEALTVFEEGQLRRIEQNTLLNEQMVVQEELTLRKIEHYGAINVSMTLQEELTLRQIENYILLNEQRLAYLETASVLIETQSVMNEGLALFTETLTISAEQITTGATLMTESLALLGETTTLSTTQVIEANTLTSESYILLVAANQSMVESQVIYGQTMTDTTAIVAASNVTMGESMTVMETTITTAAGTVDTATIAANNSMNLMSLTMTTGAGDIDTAAGTARTAMDGFAQAMKDVATAASTAAGIAAAGASSAGGSALEAKGFSDAAKGFASAADGFAASTLRSSNDASSRLASINVSVDGSHAGGLDYVPFNGYLGRLHEGEGVLTKAENAEYRKGDRVAPASSVRSNSNDNSELRAIRRELQESRKEQELTRKEMAAMRKENSQLLAVIASNSGQHIKETQKGNKVSERMARKVAGAN